MQSGQPTPRQKKDTCNEPLGPIVRRELGVACPRAAHRRTHVVAASVAAHAADDMRSLTKRTLANAHRQAHTHTHAHTRPRTRTHTHTHTHTQAHAHAYAQKHTHTPPHTHAHAHAHTRTHAHAYTQKHTHTRTRTQLSFRIFDIRNLEFSDFRIPKTQVFGFRWCCAALCVRNQLPPQFSDFRNPKT
jgi:hypothetical protein